jgi:methionine-rich copper-binding protein CopC
MPMSPGGRDARRSAGRAVARAVARAAAVVAGAALTGVWPTAAWAHTDLVASWPSDGERVTSPVAELRLEFDAEVVPELSGVRVGAGGQGRAAAVTGSGATLTVPVEPLRRPGTYEVAYRVVAADGHVAVGSYSFAVAPGAGPARSAGDRATLAPPVEAEPGDRTGHTDVVAGLVGGAALACALGVGLVRRRHLAVHPQE